MGTRSLLFIVFLFLFSGLALHAETGRIIVPDSVAVAEQASGLSLDELQTGVQRPNPLRYAFKKKVKKNRKVTAAILAFPFPFGIVGVHRIYLGTKPYVPVAYIATLGGVFGILPFIDFCVILGSKDVDRFVNNGKVFMWVK